MIQFTRAHAHPIGLDIGHDSVKMIQLERVGDRLSVYAAARAPLPAEARGQPDRWLQAAMNAVNQLLKRRIFRGRTVVVAMPREYVHVRSLRLQKMPAAELIAAARGEAARSFPFDLSGAQVQMLSVGEVRQGAETRQEVIVMAAPEQGVEEFLEIARRSGLILDGLDIEPCALFRTVDRFIRRRDDERMVRVLVDVGSERSQVVIGKGREISFIKSIEIGGRHFQEAVSRKLGITAEESAALRRRLVEGAEDSETGERDPVRKAASDAVRSVMEELGREISLCLRYYSVTFRGQRPEVVKVVGGAAIDEQLLGIFNHSVSIPVEVGKPLFSVDTSRMSTGDRAGSMCQWATAFGLALKHVDGTFGPLDGPARDPALPKTSADDVVNPNVLDERSAVQHEAFAMEGAGV